VTTRRHVSYGTRENLGSEIEKLTEAGYSRSETREALQTGLFFFAPDNWASHKNFRAERFVLIWEAEE